ncbi:MAG TPA: HDIG domain-containing protein [Candidatus Kapabacteria bacterium]|nr:HDIG domain-containing protein [Candidatus Kapabacteria bacterium]
MKNHRLSPDRSKTWIRSLRRSIAQPRWRRSKSLRWTIGIALTLGVAALFPSAHTMALSGFSAGSLWTSEDVTAPFTFPVYKDQVRYSEDVRKALADGFYPVFVPDTNAPEQSDANFRASWERMRTLLSVARADTLAEDSLVESAKALGLSTEDWTALSQFAVSKNPKQFERSQHDLTELEASLLKQIGALESTRFLTAGGEEDPLATRGQNAQNFFALRLHPTQEAIFARDTLLPIQAASNRIYVGLEGHLKRNASLVRPLSELASGALVPTVAYSPTLTESSREAIVDRVPRTDGLVIEGEKIVSRGEIITPKIKASLESLSQARLERGGMVAEFGRFAGTVGHAGLLVLLIVLYLKFIRRKIYNDNAQILLLALVLFFPAVMAYLSVWIPVDFPLQYFILIPVASMLLTVLFDSRTGFYGTVVASLIVAGIRGNDYSIALAGLCAGAFAAYTVRDLRNRAQLFTSTGYIFFGYLVAIAALSLEQGTPLRDVGYELIASLGNALISPVLTLGILYLVEMTFDTMSDLRLREFDNINHPLLRELALRAPGTYQHTMMVAQLAENAAIAIGANAALAKVGAYFHDVGKLAAPQNFVENQSGDVGNIHESLSPAESAERVKNHVEQGIALARAHDLPERIIDFIPMHHGTLPISFFYQRAVMEAAGSGIVDENEFRYPGPLPNSKETAIVMLADASEAISRSLAQKGEDMSAEAIEEAIAQLIRTRFDQGQFDHSDITVRDFTMVRSVFARHLSGLHHPRITYPALAEVPLADISLSPA